MKKMEREKSIEEALDNVLANLNEEVSEQSEGVKNNLTKSLDEIWVDFEDLPEGVGEELLKMGILALQANKTLNTPIKHYITFFILSEDGTDGTHFVLDEDFNCIRYEKKGIGRNEGQLEISNKVKTILEKREVEDCDESIRKAPPKDRINPKPEVTIRHRDGRIIRDTRNEASFIELDDGRILVVTNGVLEDVTTEKVAESLTEKHRTLELKLTHQKEALEKEREHQKALKERDERFQGNLKRLKGEVHAMKDKLEKLLSTIDALSEEKDLMEQKLEEEQQMKEQLQKKVQQVEDAKLALTINAEKLEKLVFIDGLTEIFNRRAYDEEIKKRFASRERNKGEKIAHLMIDIDFFKKFNDTYGHDFGDAVLKEVAETIDHMAREGSDFVARLGGEEFVVLCDDGEPLLAERIRSAVEALDLKEIADKYGIKPDQEPEGDLTISIGISVASEEHGINDAAALYASSDKSLLEAKNTGRNRVVCDESVSPIKKES